MTWRRVSCLKGQHRLHFQPGASDSGRARDVLFFLLIDDSPGTGDFELERGGEREVPRLLLGSGSAVGHNSVSLKRVDFVVVPSSSREGPGDFERERDGELGGERDGVSNSTNEISGASTDCARAREF